MKYGFMEEKTFEAFCVVGSLCAVVVLILLAVAMVPQ